MSTDEVTAAAWRLVEAGPGVLAIAAYRLAEEIGAARFNELLDEAHRWVSTDPDGRRLEELAARAKTDPAAARELDAFSRDLARRAE